MAIGVSVALCTFNGARFVPEQLGSILGQDRAPSELVVCDDGSTDDTLTVVQDALEEYRRGAGGSRAALTVLEGVVPLGVTRNFERAVLATSEPVIALSDQDDVWHAGRLERMLARFEEDDRLDLLHTDARLVDEVGRPLGATLFESLEVSETELALEERGQAFDVFLRRNLVTGATTVFRRRILDAAVPFPENWVHDEWLAIIAAAAGRVKVLREPTIDYRQHTGNQIGVQDPTLRYKIRRVLEARGDRNSVLAARFAVLADRLEALGPTVAPGYAAAARAKADFESARAALPARRLLRLGGVFALARRGLYGRFASRGRADIIRDLLQPA